MIDRCPFTLQSHDCILGMGHACGVTTSKVYDRIRFPGPVSYKAGGPQKLANRA